MTRLELWEESKSPMMCVVLDLTFKQDSVKQESKKKPYLVFTTQTVTTQVGQEHITK